MLERNRKTTNVRHPMTIKHTYGARRNDMPQSGASEPEEDEEEMKFRLPYLRSREIEPGNLILSLQMALLSSIAEII